MNELEDRKKLLLEYYAPTLYQGVQMTDKGSLWRNSYGTQKEQAQAKLDGFKAKVRLPFSMDIALNKHLTTFENLAIVFPNNQNFILAYDLDSNEDELYAVLSSGNILKYILEDMGFNPLIYLSGAKGIHVELRFNQMISNAKLKKLSALVKSIAESKGCQYIDRCYPSRAAYRMYGSKGHYKTKVFTGIIEGNRILDSAESWEAFEAYYLTGCQGNTEAKADQAIKDCLVTKPQKAPVKAKEAPARTSIKDTAKYSIGNIEQCHINGLYGDYTRYLMAFQLGRFYSECLGYTESQARSEIEQWLKRHYKEQSLEYFGDDVSSKIKTPFSSCIKETVNNMLNGFYKGQSFKPRVILKISRRKVDKYVDSLPLNAKQSAALRYMLRVAEEYNSLIFYHSYGQLSKGFKIKHNPTIKAYLDKFIEVGAISMVMKGKYVVNGNNIATFYELTIPDHTYEIITANFEALHIPDDEAALPLVAMGTA